MRRRPKYRALPNTVLKATGIESHRDMFAVMFEDSVLLTKRSNYRRSSSPLLGRKQAVFLARDNADVVVEWAHQNSANVFAVTGNKAIFFDHEDAMICMLAFS